MSYIPKQNSQQGRYNHSQELSREVKHVISRFPPLYELDFGEYAQFPRKPVPLLSLPVIKPPLSAQRRRFPAPGFPPPYYPEYRSLRPRMQNYSQPHRNLVPGVCRTWQGSPHRSNPHRRHHLDDIYYANHEDDAYGSRSEDKTSRHAYTRTPVRIDIKRQNTTVQNTSKDKCASGPKCDDKLKAKYEIKTVTKSNSMKKESAPDLSKPKSADDSRISDKAIFKSDKKAESNKTQEKAIVMEGNTGRRSPLKRRSSYQGEPKTKHRKISSVDTKAFGKQETERKNKRSVSDSISQNQKPSSSISKQKSDATIKNQKPSAYNNGGNHEHLEKQSVDKANEEVEEYDIVKELERTINSLSKTSAPEHKTNTDLVQEGSLTPDITSSGRQEFKKDIKMKLINSSPSNNDSSTLNKVCSSSAANELKKCGVTSENGTTKKSKSSVKNKFPLYVDEPNANKNPEKPVLEEIFILEDALKDIDRGDVNGVNKQSVLSEVQIMEPKLTLTTQVDDHSTETIKMESCDGTDGSRSNSPTNIEVANALGLTDLDTRMTYLYSFKKYFDDNRTVDMDISNTPSPSKTFDNTTLSEEQLEIDLNASSNCDEVTKTCSEVVKDGHSASVCPKIITDTEQLSKGLETICSGKENSVNITTELLKIFGEDGTEGNENKCSNSRYRSKSFCSLLPGKTSTKSLRKIKSLNDVSDVQTNTLDKSIELRPKPEFSNVVDCKEELLSLLLSGCDDDHTRESPQKVSEAGSQKSATKNTTMAKKKRTRSLDNYEDESSTLRKLKKISKSNKSDKPKKKPISSTTLKPDKNSSANVEVPKHTSKEKYITKAEYVKTFGRIKSPVDVALSIETAPLASSIKRRRATFTCEADNETILKKVDKQKTRQTFLELFGPSSDDEEEELVKPQSGDQINKQRGKTKTHSDRDKQQKTIKSKPKPEDTRKISSSNSVEMKTKLLKERRDSSTSKTKENPSKEQRHRRSRSKSKEKHIDKRKSSSESRRQSTSSNDSNYKKKKSNEHSSSEISVDKKNKIKAPTDKAPPKASAHQDPEKNVSKTKSKESMINCDAKQTPTNICAETITETNKRTSSESSTNKKNKTKAPTDKAPPEDRHVRRASAPQEPEKNIINTENRESMLNCDVKHTPTNICAKKITETNRRTSRESDIMNSSLSETSLIIDESFLLMNRASESDVNITLESYRPYSVTTPQLNRLTSIETIQDECTDKVYISDSPDIRENDCTTVQQTCVNEDSDVVEITPPAPMVDLTQQDDTQEPLTDRSVLVPKKEVEDIVGVEGTITLYRAEESSSDQVVSVSVSVRPAASSQAPPALKEESEPMEEPKTSLKQSAQIEVDISQSNTNKDATTVVDLSRRIPNQGENTLHSNNVSSVASVGSTANIATKLSVNNGPSQEVLISRAQNLGAVGSARSNHGQPANAQQVLLKPSQPCQPSNLANQTNTSAANEGTVVDLTNDNQELSSTDLKIVVEIFTRHVYFLAHLCNAQRTYVESLNQRPFYNYYFKAEIALFENEKRARLLRQSTRLCSELQYLDIRVNKNLGDIASLIVEHVTVNLKNKDMPKLVTKSIVYLLMGELMRPQVEIFSSIPLFKTLIRHCNIVASKMQNRFGVPFTEEMRRTLAVQIQEYIRLFGHSPLEPNQMHMMDTTSRLNMEAAPPQFNNSIKPPPPYSSANHIVTECSFKTNTARNTNENAASVLKQFIVRPHSTTITTTSTSSDPSYLLSRNIDNSRLVQGTHGQATMNPPRGNIIMARQQPQQSSSSTVRPQNQHVFARPKLPNPVMARSNNQVTDLPGGPNTNTLGRTPIYLPCYDTPTRSQVYARPTIKHLNSCISSQVRQIPQTSTSVSHNTFATRTTPSSVQTNTNQQGQGTSSQLQPRHGDKRKQSENLLEELLTPSVNQALFAQSKAPVNDNFRIKLPFTKPITPPTTTVTTTVAGTSICTFTQGESDGALTLSTSSAVPLETRTTNSLTPEPSSDSQPVAETEDQQILVNNTAINNKYVVGEAPTRKVLNQGLHALSSIGQPSAMLNTSSNGGSITKKASPATNKLKRGNQKAIKNKTENKPPPKKRGRPLKASQPKKPTKANERVETVTNTDPDKSQGDIEKVQRKEDTDKTLPERQNKIPTPPAPQVAKEPSAVAEVEDLETIDLTWIDDMDEEELQSEMDFVFVKQENVEHEAPDESNSRVVPSPVDSGIASPPIQSEEDTIYTVVRSLCICGQIAQYNCACGDAWYCGQQCQMVDWEWHQKICPTVQETT